MATIIHLKRYKENVVAHRAFARWEERFHERFSAGTMLSDLSDETLSVLIKPGQESQNLIYDFIMGAFDYGHRARFYYMDSQAKMKVLDASLFILDQIRFECMRRLGWVAHFPGEVYGILQLILRCSEIRNSFNPRFPDVTKDNPNYAEYLNTYPADRETFVRRQISKAVEAFERKVGQDR